MDAEAARHGRIVVNLIFERPQAFILLVPVVPVLVFLVFRFRKLQISFGALYKDGGGVFSAYGRMRTAFVLRTVFWTCAWICLTAAYSAPYWGQELSPVRRQGSAVSFVVDISVSMTAADVSDGERPVTRLDLSAEYIRALLARVEHVPVSVVLTKGSGALVVPLTEDYAAVFSLLDSLSPSLLTSPGSSVGSGILSAARSFPPNTPSVNTIVVFTDGDETDGTLEDALAEAGGYGIDVILAGTGSVSGAEIVAGDGVTKVRTSLKEETMKNAADRMRRKNSRGKVFYVRAGEEGSAGFILEHIESGLSPKGTAGYEMQRKSRYRLFLLFSFAFLAAGFFAGELRVRQRRNCDGQK